MAKAITKSIGGTDIEALTGALSGDKKDAFIVRGLAKKVIKHFNGMADLLEKFINSTIVAPLKKHIDMKGAKEFISLTRKLVSPEVFPFDKMDPAGKSMVPTEEDLARGEELIKHFNGLLNSPPYARFVIMAKTLNQYQTSLSDSQNLKDFLAQPQVTTFTPLHFAKLDFKLHIWDHIDFQDNTKRQYFLMFLHLVWRRTTALVEIMKTPHYDVKEIQQVVMTIIGQVGNSVPELSRCKGAFDIIEQSVGMLKDNMPSYHSEAVRSGNPGAVFTSFISDVSKERKGKMDVKTMAQFTRIINFFKNRIQKRMNSAGKKNDKISKFLDFIDKPLSEMEAKTKEYDLDKEEQMAKNNLNISETKED